MSNGQYLTFYCVLPVGVALLVAERAWHAISRKRRPR